MTEIDSIGIKISASSEQANKTIIHLIRSLDTLSASLKFDTSSLEKLGNINGNNFKKIAEGLQSFANAAKSLQNVNSSNFTKLANGINKIASIDSSKLEALGKIDGNSFRGLGEGVKALSSGLQNLQGIKKSDFNRLATGLERLVSIQQGNMNAVGGALIPLANGINILSNAKFDNSNLQNLINSLTRLSNANTGSLANIDFTSLANSIKSLTNILSSAEKVQQNTISMTNAIAKLASAGASAGLVTTALPQLGIKLKEFFNVMSGVDKIEENTIAFTNAIAMLANAGKKAEITARGLPELAVELKNFFQTMSNAPNISNSVIRMTEALSHFSTSNLRISSSSNVAEKSIKRLINSLNNLKNPILNATKSLKNMANQLLSSFGIYVSFRTAISGLKKAIISSMDYVEVLNYFNAAFGQVAEKADLNSFKKLGYDSSETYYNSFSQRAEQLTQKMSGFKISENGMALATGEKSMGINPSLIMNYQAMFAQMSSSMGIASETSLKLSQTLTEIGADLASVKNMDFEKVWEDMASGLAGMSRTLDKYGVNIRNVNLQQKLNELGIEANISALNQNDKALLRTIILLDSTRYAWGDLADTINQPANQLRLLQSNFANLGRTIGNIFLPIVAKVLPYINSLVMSLQRLAEWIVKLAGFEDFDWGGTSGIGGMDMSDILDQTEEESAALDEATKSAKKLKNQLQKFDELNVINTQDDTSKDNGKGIGTGDYGLLEGALDKILEEYQSAWDKAFSNMEERTGTFADNVSKAFKEGGLYGVGKYIGSELTKAMNNIPWDNIYKGARSFGTGLAQFLNGLISPELFGALGRTIASSLNTALYFLNSFGKTFDWENFGLSIATGINEFFKTFDFKTAADTINTWLKGVLTTAATLLKETNFEQIGNKIGVFLKELDFTEILSDVATVIWEAIKGAFDLLKGLFKEAPLEASLITAFSLMKFTKLGKKVRSKIATAIMSTKLITELTTAWTSLGGLGGILTTDLATIMGAGTAAEIGMTIGIGIIGGIAAAFIGFEVGKEIGTWLFPEDAEWYDNFSWKDFFGALNIEDFTGAIKEVFKDTELPITQAAVAAAKIGEEIKKTFAGIGENIVNGLFAGIVMPENIKTWLKEHIVDPIVNGIKELFGIHSPSTVMSEIGGYIMEGLKEGIENMVKKVINLFSDIKNKIVNVWNNVKTKTSEIWTIISNTLSTKWGNFKTWASDRFGKIKDSVTGAWDKAKEETTNKWKDVSDTLNAKWSNFETWASEKFGKVKNSVTGAWKEIKKETTSKWKDVSDTLSAKWGNFETWASEKFSAVWGSVKDAWKNIKDKTETVWKNKGGVTSILGDSWETIKTSVKDALTGNNGIVSKLSDAWDSIKITAESAWKKIGNAILSPIEKAVNGVIKGINWVLEKVGSTKKLELWNEPTGFAKGTGGLKKDTIGMVNDQRGSVYREMIVPPNGKPFIPEGRNVMLPLKKGTKIMPAKQTKEFMSNMNNIPHFAKGVGDFFSGTWSKIKELSGDIWNYISNPKELAKIAINKFTDLSGIIEPMLSIAKGTLNTAFDGAAEFLSGILEEEMTVKYNPSAGVEQWRGLAAKALKMTSQFSEINLSRLLMQMQTESGGNPNAVNNWDINAKLGHPSKGLMQVIDSTFKTYALAPYDKNIFDPLSNILASIRYTVARYGSLVNGWKGHGYKDGIGKIKFSDLVPAYKNGGFPEPYSIFAAGEQGRAEILGTVGGKTAVAGGTEITGIKEAVYDTSRQELELLRQQNQLLAAILEKDTSVNNAEIFRSVQKSARNYFKSTGNPAFPF